MKKLIVIIGTALSLITTQCRADFFAPAGQKDQLGVIVAMEKINVAGTSSAGEYTPHGSNFGTQIGSHFGFLGGLVGMVVGAVGHKVVNSAQSNIDGYKVTIRFDDGQELIREKRADQLNTSRFGVGSRVRVVYTPETMHVFASEAPMPAIAPTSDTAKSKGSAAEQISQQNAEISKVDAPGDGIIVSLVNKQ